MGNITSSEDEEEEDDDDVSIAPVRYSVTWRRGDHSVVSPRSDVPRPNNERMIMEQQASSVVAYFVAGLTKTEAASTPDDHDVGSTTTNAFSQTAPAAATAVAATVDDHGLGSKETSETEGFRHRGASETASVAAARPPATQTTTAQQTLLIPVAPKPTETNQTGVSSVSSFALAATTAAGMKRKAHDAGDGGLTWPLHRPSGWDHNYEQLKVFKKKYGHTRVPSRGEWKSLQAWLYRCKKSRNGTLGTPMSRQQIDKLDKLGVDWKVNAIPTRKSWDESFGDLETFVQRNGHCSIPQTEVRLGQWLREQKARWRGKRLSALTNEQIEKLKSVGVSW